MKVCISLHALAVSHCSHPEKWSCNDGESQQNSHSHARHTLLPKVWNTICRLRSALALHTSQSAASLSLLLSLSHTHTHTQTHTEVFVITVGKAAVPKGVFQAISLPVTFNTYSKLPAYTTAPHWLGKEKWQNGGTTTMLFCTVQMVDTKEPAYSGGWA